MEYPDLKKMLDSLPLLKEEKQMWLRLGMYVDTNSYASQTHFIKVVKLYDAMLNHKEISERMGHNLRTSILSWWEVEKVKPRHKEVEEDPTGLSQLENRTTV